MWTKAEQFFKDALNSSISCDNKMTENPGINNNVLASRISVAKQNKASICIYNECVLWISLIFANQYAKLFKSIRFSP